MTTIEWISNQNIQDTINIPNDALFRGRGSKNITLTYTGPNNQPILKIDSNFTDIRSTATIENLIIDGGTYGIQNGIEGIRIEDVYNAHIRNLTIKNCAIGIKLTATTTQGIQRYSESNHLEHIRMINVGKGIVFDKGAGTGSFAFTDINDVGITLTDASTSVGIEIGAAGQPYSSLVNVNVWMGPNNPGTGLVTLVDNNPTPPTKGEVKGGFWHLAVYNAGTAADGYGMNLNGAEAAIETGNFFLAHHNLSPDGQNVINSVINPGTLNNYTAKSF